MEKLLLNKIKNNNLKLIKAIEGVKDRFHFAPFVLDKIKTNNQMLGISDNIVDVEFSTDDKNIIKTRTKTTLARYIRRQLYNKGSGISDENLESFSKAVVSILVENATNFTGLIKILRGKDILKFYIDGDKKTPSCMTGVQNSDKIKMYEINPTKICLVTCQNLGRALLWTGDDGVKLLDYAYPFYSQSASIIKAWAKNRGYAAVQDYNAPKMKVTVKTTEQYPRLDTLKYVNLNKKNKTAVLYNYSNPDVNCIMDSIYGKYRDYKHIK